MSSRAEQDEGLTGSQPRQRELEHADQRTPDPRDTQAQVAARSIAPISERVRRQVLSQTRIKVAFVVVTLTLLVEFAATMTLSVDRIFGWLTPVTRRDLYWKVKRGVAELGRTTDLGVLLRDQSFLRKAAADYEVDDEVRLFEVRDAQDAVLYRHRKGATPPELLFRGPPRRVSEQQEHLWSWTPVEVEGQLVGQIGLAVSTERLKAGENLRGEILQVALAAGVWVSPCRCCSSACMCAR